MQSIKHTTAITTAALKVTTTIVRHATKDAGRVRIGGGAIHYGDATPARDATKDAGRVRIGGGAIHYGDATPARDAIKDAGRVQIGGGAICF